MAHQIVALIAEYGLWLVFLNVLAAQAGLPLPAMPTLVVAGTLAAAGRLPWWGVLLAALVACLLSDGAWYAAGRRYGAGVMRTLCRISLSPDSCVRQSELRFQRWRAPVLLVAKFVPGLSTVTPPLVGAMGLPPRAFLLFDALGSLLWAGVAVALGYVFADSVERALALFAGAGPLAAKLLGALLAAYVLFKWWQRRRLLVALRMARIEVDELALALRSAHPPLVFDVRAPGSRELDDRLIPGALAFDPPALGAALTGVPRERELVLYCNCPNEVSAAKAAMLLRAGAVLQLPHRSLRRQGGDAAEGAGLSPRPPAAWRAGRLGGGRLRGRASAPGRRADGRHARALAPAGLGLRPRGASADRPAGGRRRRGVARAYAGRRARRGQAAMIGNQPPAPPAEAP